MKKSTVAGLSIVATLAVVASASSAMNFVEETLFGTTPESWLEEVVRGRDFFNPDFGLLITSIAKHGVTTEQCSEINTVWNEQRQHYRDRGPHYTTVTGVGDIAFQVPYGVNGIYSTGTILTLQDILDGELNTPIEVILTYHAEDVNKWTPYAVEPFAVVCPDHSWS